PPGLIYECKNERYLQAATFKKSIDDGNQYFMIVNRRCSPYISGGDNGGRRFIRVKFDANSTSFSGFNNWKIINLEDNSTVVTFDKQVNSLLDLGWYLPGEGKLFRLAPVMQEGGTLVADESFGAVNFTCMDTVLKGGKNITITGNTATISFIDSATIIMNGGTFQSSDAASGPQGPQKNTFQGVSGNKWRGLWLTNCSVKLYNSKFQDIKSDITGGRYAVNSVDCPLNDIRYNIFISPASGGDTAGGVNISYIDSSPLMINSYVMYNTFTMNNSYSRAVQVQSFAGLTAGTYVKGNTMTSNGNATGVFLSTITGGVVKQNSITNFSIGINSLLSSVDIYGNTITNTVGISRGIVGTASSSLNMAPSGNLWTGGFNITTNTSGNSKNVDVNNSVFTIGGGLNKFDVLY
ncbi:MAG: hypothetical protein ACRDFC_01215, partial [Ignavibacteria bacterium]